MSGGGAGIASAHLPVLFAEVMDGLAVERDGTYLDGTFGRGGHVRGVLQRLGEKGRLLAMDKDPDAIAEATQNRRFPEFLQLIRSGIIPRGELQGSAPGSRPKDYNLHLQEEHGQIVDAIIEGNADAARERMRAHHRGSLERYKVLLRSRTMATEEC